MFRLVVSAVIVLMGLSALLFGAFFVQGPVFYWANPFQADAVKFQALILGSSACVVGSISLAFAWARQRATRRTA